jgi:hypothetical protein
MTCPACSGKRLRDTSVFGVQQCGRCETIFGQCYRGDSYTLVAPYMASEPVPADRLRFYDLTILGSDGVSRSHGWYDPSTKLVHQVG